MRQSVILAAGNGHRINSTRQGIPKPLVHVAGRPLIEHALAQAIAGGCDETVVVLGFGAELIRAHLERLELPIALEIVYNPEPDRPNGISLLAAEPYVDDQFFLQMADHVFSRPVLRLLEGPAASPMGLLVDYAPAHFDEFDATKVRVQGNIIAGIGKHIAPWDAIDAGYFRLDRRVFDALRKAARLEEPSVSAGMQQLATAGLLVPIQLDGVAWVDVDTPADRDEAEELLSRHAPAAAG